MPVIPYQILPANGSDSADEWMRLGFACQQTGDLPKAQGHYNQCLRLDPRHALALNNLAIVFCQSSLLNEASLCIERATIIDPTKGIFLVNWSLMLMDLDRVDDAIAKARRAVELAPDEVSALMALAMMLPQVGAAKEAVALYNRILDKEPKNAVAAINACFVQTLTDCGPKELREQRDRWYKGQRYEGQNPSHKNEKNPDRVLRVGYVGGDFKSHSAAFIFSRVLWHHTPAVEMFLYSSLPVDPVNDPKTKRFQEAAGKNWRDITQLNDEQAADLIRSEKIDILVDLAAHTNGGRLGIFTRKPAPIQVTAWGFAHGTGLPEMDYFFADPVAVPEGERQFYSEKIWDLPCIVTIEEPVDYNLKAYSALPYHKNGYVTYGSFTRFEKLSDECLKCFAEILRRVPDSRIEFKDAALKRPCSIRHILARMEGIAPERILFSTATTHPDHMLSYQQCDIFLNPFPHSSGVVTGECLFMGVPMVTLNGTQAAGRSAASVLTAMGRTQWIAKTPEQYVEIAVQMSLDPKPLGDIRKVLRQELLNSPVVKGYVEAVEAGYLAMFKKWCEQ